MKFFVQNAMRLQSYCSRKQEADAWMLTVEKIEQAPVLMEAPSLQDLVKPYHGQYKTTVEPKIVAKSRTWLVVKVR